jgi:hypothetical protein
MGHALINNNKLQKISRKFGDGNFLGESRHYTTVHLHEVPVSI